MSEASVRRLTALDAPAVEALLRDGERFGAIPNGSIAEALALRGEHAVAAFGAFDESGELLAAALLDRVETPQPALSGATAAGLASDAALRRACERAVDEAILRRRDRLTCGGTAGPAASALQELGFTGADGALARELPTDPAGRAPAIRRRLAGRRVMLVPYTHCDWAWVHTRHWHARRYVLVFEEVLARMREEPAYRYTMDNVACQLAPLIEQRPDLLVELRQRVAEGRFAAAGGYSNVRPHMVGDETFVRNQQIGRRHWLSLFPEADLSVHHDAVDVATGHPQLPQILTQSGYRYLRTWRPLSGPAAKGVPTELVWEGLDGSRVLMARGCYGGLWALDEATAGLADARAMEPDALLATLWDAEIEDRTRHAGGSVVWLSRGCDDTRPGRMIDDAPFDENGLVEAWNRLGAAPMRFATAREFFAELEAERDALPVWRGTIDPCDVCYNAAWNGERGLAVQRVENDRALIQAEALAALAKPLGCAFPTGRMEDLWRDHLLSCAHATQWLYREDFAEIKEKADRVGLEARHLARLAAGWLTDATALPEETLGVVWNPLPYPRRALVRATLSKTGDVWPKRLVDAEGQPLVQQAVRALTGQGGFPELDVIAVVDLPALGCAALREAPAETLPSLEPPRTAPMDGDLAMGPLCLRLREGAIASVRARERQWDAPEGQAWDGLWVQDVAAREGPLHVGPIVGEHGTTWHSAEVVESGPARWLLRRCGEVAGMPVELDVSAPAHEERLDFELRLRWAPRDGFLTVRLPLAPGAALTGDIPFGVERKDLDDETYLRDAWGSRHSIERYRDGLFYAKSFVACEAGGAGCAIVSRNTDRYYLRRSDGRGLEHLLINSVVSLEDWERNVEPSTLFGEGSHVFRWSLLFYEGGWRDASLVRRAQALRAEPLRMMDRLCHGRAVSRAWRAGDPLLEVEPDNVAFSALQVLNGAPHLRLVESTGQRCEAVARFGWPLASAVAVDLTGQPLPGVSVAVEGGEVRVGLEPWRIVTLRLEWAPRPGVS